MVGYCREIASGEYTLAMTLGIGLEDEKNDNASIFLNKSKRMISGLGIELNRGSIEVQLFDHYAKGRMAR